MAKIVEVLNGVVTVSSITFWDSVAEIPDDVPKIYFEAPDNVDVGWRLIDGEWHEPVTQESEQQEPDITELVQAEMLLNQMDIIDRLNTVEMGNAEMLLMLVEKGV